MVRLRLAVLFFASALALSVRAADPAAVTSATELFRNRQWAEAQQAFEALAQADPADPAVHTHLGRLALQRNDHVAAVTHLEKAAALQPTSSPVQQWLGDAYGLSALKAGLFSKMTWAGKCRVAYEKAVQLDPKNLKARTSLLNYYLQAPALVGGGTDKALAQAEAVMAINPAQGRLLRAQVHIADKHYDLAFAAFEEALQEKPDDYAALFQLGRLAATSGQRLDAGRDALRRCLTLPPASGQPGIPTVQWRLGNILEKQGDLAGARAAYEASLKADPKFSQAIDALKKLPPQP